MSLTHFKKKSYLSVLAFLQLSFTPKQMEASGVHVGSQGPHRCLWAQIKSWLLSLAYTARPHEQQVVPANVHLHPAGPTPFISLHYYTCTHGKTLQLKEDTESQGPHSCYCTHSRPQTLLQTLTLTTVRVSAGRPCHYTGTSIQLLQVSMRTPLAQATTITLPYP